MWIISHPILGSGKDHERRRVFRSETGPLKLIQCKGLPQVASNHSQHLSKVNPTLSKKF